MSEKLSEGSSAPLITCYVNWEARPAVLVEDVRAFAIVDDSGWIEVNRAEVIDSGRRVSADRFHAMFPGADISALPWK